MKTRDRRAAAAVLCGAVAALAVSGCGGSTATDVPRGTMMGAGSGYHYSSTTCSAPDDLTGTIVQVRLADMNMTRMVGGVAPTTSHMRLMASTTRVPAGRVTLVAGNVGWRTHELVVLPLANGAHGAERVPGADGRVSETGSLGEASASCAAGSGEGIRAGTTGWVTLTLPRGRYELVCNLRHHYAAGMHRELDVD